MQYNPLLIDMKNSNNDDHLTRRILENGIWYSGIEQDIQKFYRRIAPKFVRNGQQSESLNYFWGKADENFRKIHSGFPQLISEKMVDLLVGNGYEIKVEGKDEEVLQDILDDILKDNKFKSMLLNRSIETESWAGGVAWKMSWNPTLSEYPIIEAWQPENYTNEVVSGRIQKDIFFIYYDKNNTRYRLNEIYGVDDKGSYIDYKLEQLQGGEWEHVSLAELEETKDLKRISFEGYYKRLSLYKPNKLPNSEFRNSVLGESDYAGSYGAFDAIDEILSTWIQEFRDGKLYRYFPEELVKRNANGDLIYPDSFIKDHTFYEDSPSENIDKQKIIYEQGDIRVEKHIESYKIWVQQAINNAGLSPLTIGITGLEALNANELSQQEREKVSIRTRNKKCELWQEFLEDYLKIVLEFHLMTENLLKNDNNTYNAISLPDFDIKVNFNDYIIKSMKDRTDEVAVGLGKTWDITTGVQYVHKDKTEREQLAIAAKIKLEQGLNSITQAELSALQAENEIYNDLMVEEGVELVEVPGNEEVETEEVLEEEVIE